MHKMMENSDKKQKEIEKLTTETTVLKVKVDEKEKALEYAREENRKLFEQLKETMKKQV